MSMNDRAALDLFADLCARALEAHGTDLDAVERYVSAEIAALSRERVHLKAQLTRLARRMAALPESVRRH